MKFKMPNINESFWILPKFLPIGMLQTFSDVVVIMPMFRYYEIERYQIFQIYSSTLLITAIFHLLMGYLADRIGSNYIPRILTGINCVFFFLCLIWIAADSGLKSDLDRIIIEIDPKSSGVAFNESEKTGIVILTIRVVKLISQLHNALHLHGINFSYESLFQI